MSVYVSRYLSDPAVGGQRDTVALNARPAEVSGKGPLSCLQRVAQYVDLLFGSFSLGWVGLGSVPSRHIKSESPLSQVPDRINEGGLLTHLKPENATIM